jgi:hypothetical protein
MSSSKITSALTVLTLAAFMLGGCASGGSSHEPVKTQNQSSSPQPSESPSPQVPGFDYSAEIVLAKNDLELEFLTIAINSCKRAQLDGFMITDSDGMSYFRPSTTGIFPEWPFDEFRVSNGNPTSPKWTNYPPGIFNPCSLEHQARGRDISQVGFEHKVTKISASQYIWAEHGGGYSLQGTTFDVKDGLIVKDTFGEGELSYSAKYGPFSKSELDLFQVTE